jgi:hypothetical protein
MKKEKFVLDPVTEEMHKRAKELGIRTVWERYNSHSAGVFVRRYIFANGG